MSPEEKQTLENRLPEAYRKAKIIGALGGLIGGGIGGYISFLKSNYIYAGIGAGIGIILGQLVGILLKKQVGLKPLVEVETNTELVLAVLSFLMTLAGVIGFFRTGEMIGILGAAFFALCGIYLVMKYRRRKKGTG